MIPKVPRCTVDMLNQILYYKTKDGGKTFDYRPIFNYT